MRRLAALALVSALLGVCATAQRPPREHGAYYVPFEWGNERGVLSQRTGGPNWYAFAPDEVVLEDARAGGDAALVKVPIDVPSDCVYVGEGVFVVAGRIAATGEGMLLRLDLTRSPLAVELREKVSLGIACDPSRLVYDAGGKRLLCFDEGTGYVHMAPWDGMGALPREFAVVVDGWRPTRPFVRLLQDEGGFRLVRTRQDTALLSSEVRDTESVLRVTEPFPGVWCTEEYVSAAAIQSLDPWWELREPEIVPVHGSIEVRCRQGRGSKVLVRDEVTQESVTIECARWPWQRVDVPEGKFVAGRRYRLVDPSTLESSASFSPSFRFGAATTLEYARMERGRMRPLELQVGNPHFVTQGTLREAHVAKVWLLVAAEEPLPDAVVTMAGDAALLAHPLVALPSTHPITLQVSLPLPVDDHFAGAALLFQWVVELPEGKALVSDVFGSRVLPRLGMPAETKDLVAQREGVQKWLAGLPGAEEAQALHRRIADAMR
ncbi:MAG: hypothetical protein KA020_06200 [Planctomycetes bacterium]|nr:hypothetical protein [Planctomycetota bacterium]MCC7064778.1 hypothetical protein [Planctomycetota bacterium]